MKFKSQNAERVETVVEGGFDILRGSAGRSGHESARILIAIFALRLSELIRDCSDRPAGEAGATSGDSGRLSPISLGEIFGALTGNDPRFEPVTHSGILEPIDLKLLFQREEKALLQVDDLICRFLSEEDSEEAGELFQVFLDRAFVRLSAVAGGLGSPPSLTRLVACLADPDPDVTMWDPHSGTGGFLASVNRHLIERDGVSKIRGIAIADSAFAEGLVKLQLFFSGMKASVEIQNLTQMVAEPGMSEGNFDLLVTNPPFGKKVDVGGGIGYRLFGRGWMYSEEALFSLMLQAGSGAATIISLMPNGFLFRGGASREIREQILTDGILDAVIALPAGMFYNTVIPACLIMVKKSRDHDLPPIFIDASNEFREGKHRRELIDEGIDRIVEVYRNRVEIEGFSRALASEEIMRNDCDLSISRYVIPPDERPELNFEEEWGKLQEMLREHEKLAGELAGLLRGKAIG